MDQIGVDSKYNPALIIMAAGMAKRYFDSGADKAKQLDAVTGNDPIWCFNVYTAMKDHGIKTIGLIIRKDFEEQYRAEFGKRMEKWIEKMGGEVRYAYQDSIETIKKDLRYEYRAKMWGTGEALICTKQANIKGPWIICNGDDHYGLTSTGLLVNFVNSSDYKPGEHTFAMPGYVLKNVLSEHGGVTRGVCRQDHDGWLTEIIETKDIKKPKDKTIGTTIGHAIEQDIDVELSLEALISMNMWLMDEGAYELFESAFAQFKASNQTAYKWAINTNREKVAKHEFLIPSTIDILVKDGIIKVKVVRTEDAWFGITHLEDKNTAADILRAIYSQVYPKDLWDLHLIEKD